MTKPVKRKAKGTVVNAWAIMHDGMPGSAEVHPTRASARRNLRFCYSGSRVRPIRITILEGKG